MPLVLIFCSEETERAFNQSPFVFPLCSFNLVWMSSFYVWVLISVLFPVLFWRSLITHALYSSTSFLPPCEISFSCAYICVLSLCCLCIYCLSLHVYFVVSSVVLCRIFLHVCVSVHSVFSCKVHRVRCLVHGLLIFCVLWELSFNAAFWGYSCLSIPASRSTSLLSFHDNFFTFLKTTLHSTCAPAISKCFLLCTLLVVAKKIIFANYWGNSICLILFCKKPKKKKKEKKDHLCKRPAESSERLLFGWIYCLAERQRPLSLESSIS